MKQIRHSVRLALLLAGAGLGSVPGAGTARAEPEPPPGAPMVFATGAEPLSDAEYAALPKTPTFRAFLPKRMDLTDRFPKPGYQGQQPNCVAWATTYAARSFLYAQDVGHQPTGPDEQMSPAYVYNRMRRPGSMCDTALRIPDALEFLKREGTVTLADFPDDPSRCPFPAPEALKDKATRYRLAGWSSVKGTNRLGLGGPLSIEDIRGALANGQPVVFQMPVAEDFKALKGDTIYKRSEPAKATLHAMTVAGYDDEKQAFRVINSWGSWWADKGYAWIDYDTFGRLVSNAYVLEDAPARKAPAPVPDAAPVRARPPREVLDEALAKLGCGLARVDESGRRLVIGGFAGDAGRIAAVRQAALALDPAADVRLARRPWPQCEAEMTLADALADGAVGLVAQTATGRPRRGDPVAMKAGELFGISADVPAGKTNLSLIYLQADGSAVELYRGSAEPATAGGHSVTIGLSGEAAARFRVAPPFGDESVIALASTVPLFGDELADYATEREFLTALRRKLATVPPGSVSAAVLRLRTAP